MKSYTKAQLEKIVLAQLENLSAMNDLLIVMKTQTELVNEINRKMEFELRAIKPVSYPRLSRKRKLFNQLPSDEQGL